MSPRDDIPGDDTPQDPTLSLLYRELPDVAPAADTDALIRAAARRAVGAGPHRGRVAAHWRGLGSAAAMLLLGVALTVQWRTREPARLDEALATAPASQPAAPPATDAALDALSGGAPAPASAVPARSPAATVANAAKASTAGTARQDRTTPADAAIPAEGRNELMADAAKGTPAVAAAPPAPRPESMAEATGGVAPSAPALAGAAAAAAPAPQAMEGRLAKAVPAATVSGERETSQKELPRRQLAADALKAMTPGAAPAASAPASDYRVALAAGRYADALDLLAAPATAEARLDRELLLQWLQPGHRPDCADVAPSGDAALLCEGLARRAAGQAPASAWRARVEAAGLASGEYAYRRSLVNALFGPPPQP